MTDAGPDWASLAAYHADRALTVEDLPWDARCRLHEIRECLAALGGPAGRTLAEKAAAAYERVEELRQACARQNEDVCQTLGKALGYPWFKDEQTAFPGATEEHGVCVGDHVAETIAAEAAAEIRRLREKVGRQEMELERSAKAMVGDLEVLRVTPEEGVVGRHWAVKLLAASFHDTFKTLGGKNYIETGVGPVDGVWYVVTIQREDGKTPATLRNDAEERAKALEAELELIKNPPPAAAHQWRDGPLKRCIRCGDVPACCPASQAPCDPAKMDGKTEACCECGGDYPARDLISGEVFCPECRRKPWATGGVVPAGGEPVPAMLADSFSWTYNPDVYSNLQGLFARGG